MTGICRIARRLRYDADTLARAAGVPLFHQFAACMPCFLGEPEQRNPQEQSGGNKENSRTIGLTETEELT